MNKTAAVSPSISFSEAELETITKIDSYDLRKYQPEGFPVPYCWAPNSQGHWIYTWRGAECLAYGLEHAGKVAEANGRAEEAAKLIAAAELIRVEMKTRREAQPVAPVTIAKNDSFAWQERADLK